MDQWNVLEYVAWALSALFGGLMLRDRDHAKHVEQMLLDLARIDSTYDNDLLTSSREGEIEATQERHEI